MKLISYASVTIFCVMSAASLLADQVTLKNGDRISGAVIKYDGKNLVMKTELAGDVTIPWENVTGISSATPLNVGLASGEALVGPVQAADAKITVDTKESGAVSAPRASITYIRSKEEEAAYQAQIERYRNPSLTDLWVGFLDLGYAQSKGNADAGTFNLTANATRATSRDKITAYFSTIYSRGMVPVIINGTQTKVSAVTADAKRGGIAYNVNLNKKWFGFGSVDLENDRFQDLDLRFVPAGGLGYHWIQNDKTQLDLSAGAALNREFYTTLSRTRAEAVLGETLVHKFSKVTALNEKFFFYPGFSGGERMNFDIGLVTAIRKWFGWQVAFSDRYNSMPLPGFKTNDVMFTTGARLTFAK